MWQESFYLTLPTRAAAPAMYAKASSAAATFTELAAYVNPFREGQRFTMHATVYIHHGVSL